LRASWYVAHRIHETLTPSAVRIEERTSDFSVLDSLRIRPRASFLIDHRGRGLGHKGLVAQLGVGFGDFALQAGGLFAQAGLFGGHVDFHEQAQAGIAHHGHGGRLCSGRPAGFVGKHLDFAELGQGCSTGATPCRKAAPSPSRPRHTAAGAGPVTRSFRRAGCGRRPPGP
jgi:hypothetical protein